MTDDDARTPSRRGFLKIGGAALAGAVVGGAGGAAIGAGIAYLFQYKLKHLYMIVLLIGNDIYRLIELEFVVLQLGCAEILGDVHRCAIASEQQLFVEAVVLQVYPY